MDRNRLVVGIVTAALGGASALGVAACGDDDEGRVEIEGGTTGTGTAATTTTPGTVPETTPTAPETTPTSP